MRREGLRCIALGGIRWGKGALRWVGLRSTSPGRAARRLVPLGGNGSRLRIPLGWHPGRNSARNDRSLGNRARCIPRRNTRLLL